ncbi:MAG: hypothetical protein PHT59_06490 [Candidatus Omnitrophica bacterium]|nr:hypothetical protein [Candidatus Omnitrophota bacterium]
MADEMWTTLAILKSEEYIGITDTTCDAPITQLIKDVTAQMIDYLDNDGIDADDPPVLLERACALQAAYEWKRRKDKGISATTYPDGTTTKITVDEWLPDVKEIMLRNMEYAI